MQAGKDRSRTWPEITLFVVAMVLCVAASLMLHPCRQCFARTATVWRLCVAASLATHIRRQQHPVKDATALLLCVHCVATALFTATSWHFCDLMVI